MLFSRRNPEKILARALSAIWPRGGLQRGWLYIWHRLKRLNNRPHAVAMGFAIGVFISFTPFLGLHLTLCVLLSLMLRGSILASLIGQVFGNPVTLPVIYFTTWKVGEIFVPGAGELSLDQLSISFLLENWQSLFMPLCIGGFVVGLPVAATFYFLILGLLMWRKSAAGAA